MVKNQLIKFKVIKKGRKWLHIVQEGRNEKYQEKLLINSLTENLDAGSCAELFVQSEGNINYKGYWDWQHTAVDAEEVKEAERQKNIDKWICYVRENFKDGRIYNRGIEELHKLECYDFDDEIEEKIAAIEAERAKTRREFYYPCEYHYFRKGSILVEDGEAWEVIYFEKFLDDLGLCEMPCPYWCYRLVCKSISDTEAGKKAIKNKEIEKEIKRIEKEELSPAVAEMNELFTLITEKISKADELKKEHYIASRKKVTEVLYDDVEYDGTGRALVVIEDKILYFVNNSGYCCWDANNICYEGIEGYGSLANKAIVEEEISRYRELKKNISDIKKKIEEYKKS